MSERRLRSGGKVMRNCCTRPSKSRRNRPSSAALRDLQKWHTLAGHGKDGPRSPQPLEFPLLDNTQKLHLQARSRSPISSRRSVPPPRLQVSRSCGFCTGECPFSVPESSLSSVLARLAQCTGKKGLPDRRLRR